MLDMLSLIAVVQKEWLLLMRDKAGLLVLFVMPAVLVVVITLVQENVLKAIGENETRILLIDDDGEALGRQIAEVLEKSEGVTITRTIDGRTPDRQEAIALVARGKYQLCLIIPADMTRRVQALARLSIRETLAGNAIPGKEGAPPPVIALYFDPTVLGAFRSAVRHLMDLMVARLEMQEKTAALAQLLPERIDQALKDRLNLSAQQLDQLPRSNFRLEWPETPLLKIENRETVVGKHPVIPTSVQQNVPAYSLFGIFFIVLPMAGAFIQERINGTYQRLLTMPVNDLTLVLGRIIAYVGIGTGQCLLIGCIGKWLLPLWGAPPLEVGGSLPALGVMVACAILAATGYGILLGTLVNSFEQAAMVGPISIVIAAAIGGIMVPVYAMPPFMQRLSTVSPLAWGLNGALDVFVRGGSLVDVLPEAGALAAFFIACLLLAGFWRRHRRRRGSVD